MAMHKSKKTKRFQPGGLVDSEGNPVRDGSGNPIMTGSFPEEDEITARGRAKNAEMFRSLFNRATGRGKEVAPAAAPASTGPAAGTSSLRDPQQMAEQRTAPKFSDGDVDERDRRMEAAASAPSRAITSPSSSGPKPSVSKAPVKAKPSAAPAATTSRGRGAEKGSAPKQTMGGPYRDEGRNRPAPAAPEKRPGTALPINPSVLRQREEAEKKRDAARAAKRKESEAKEEKFTKDLSSDPGQVALKKKREEEDKMSPAQRSAARGKAIKEFSIKELFGMAKGGSVSSASKRADGIAQRGKTRGKVY
jgi:hypothetical protein